MHFNHFTFESKIKFVLMTRKKRKLKCDYHVYFVFIQMIRKHEGNKGNELNILKIRCSFIFKDFS